MFIYAQHVVVDRDAWDWLAIGATIVGSFLALAALVVAIRALRTVTDDRRRVFELGVLRDLIMKWSSMTPQEFSRDVSVKMLAERVPDLPSVAEWLYNPQVKPVPMENLDTPAGEARMDYILNIGTRIPDELTTAIRARVHH